MRGKDQYSVVLEDDLIQNYSLVLSSFYLPLIGSNALSIYLLLAGEVNQPISATLDRLCCFTNLDINEVEQSIVSLEQMDLLATYHKKGIYLFVLKSPLTIRQFLSHEVYSRFYMEKVGNSQYGLSLSIHKPYDAQTDKYENITHKFDASSLNNWSESDEESYQQQNAKLYEDDAVNIQFNYAQFNQLCSRNSLAIPVCVRTKENMTTIGQLATVYGISVQQMFSYVKNCVEPGEIVNNEIVSGSIDFEKLRKCCLKEKEITVPQVEDTYSLSPDVFLYSLQKVPVSSPDKKLLESLQIDYHLKPEVVNVLIETTLNNCNQQLSQPYMEKTAGNWARLGIDSKEKALQQVNYKKPSASKKKQTVKYDKSEMEAQETDLEALRELMFAKKGQ